MSDRTVNSLLTGAFQAALKHSDTPPPTERRLAYIGEVAKVLVERLQLAVADGDLSRHEMLLALIGAARVAALVKQPPTESESA